MVMINLYQTYQRDTIDVSQLKKELNDARSFLFIRINHRYTIMIIDCLLTQILRIDEEEFSLQNLSSDKPLPRLLASCKSI